MARRYEQKLENVQNWVEIFNYHWDRLKGEYHNDEEFWNDTYHSMRDLDWDDFCQVGDVLTRQYPEDFRRYPNFAENLNEVNKRVMLGKPIIKRFNRQNYNKAPFNVVLTVKDVINELNGTPTKQWPKEQPKSDQPQTELHKKRIQRQKKIDDKVEIFGNLFDY